MKPLLLLSLVTAAVLGGCGDTTTGGPSPSSDGPEALTADLQRAGASVTTQGSFTPDPFPGQGVRLCVNGQPVSLYAFASAAEREQASSRIDRTDPSHVGTAIVEWVGSPRFWQRDRILVLYLGPDPAVETVLTAVLGPPFARGPVGLALRPETCS